MTGKSRHRWRKTEEVADRLLDDAFYLERYPDVRDSGIPPAQHYFQTGWAEGRWPNPLFDTNWYLQTYQDVEASGICPLLHYATVGWREGRDPHPLFSTSFYLEQRPELSAAGHDPLSHYLSEGMAALVRPHPVFDPSYYSRQCENVGLPPHQGLGHYLSVGWHKQVKPHPLFDPGIYEAALGQASPICPLEHYVRHAPGTGRFKTHAVFDGAWYLRANPDVAAAGILPLIHYLVRGFRESRPVSFVEDTEAFKAMVAGGRPGDAPALVHYVLLNETPATLSKDPAAASGPGEAPVNRAHQTPPAKARGRAGLPATLDISRILMVKEASRADNAVAVVCWDGAHNPIGRAKVLYDAVPEDRPKVLVTYLFPEFGGKLWPPLQDEGMNFLGIPWSERYLAHKLFEQLGVRFNTVWICKPRLPGFMLASNLASENARILLDIDDNEEHFSKSAGSRSKAYGLPGIGLSRTLLEKIPARTVASATLMEAFGGHMVRHARLPRNRPSGRPRKTGNVARIGFLGTVRPHKKVLDVAQKIAETKLGGGAVAEFHVYGDVAPQELRQALIQAGASVHGIVPFSQAGQIVEESDVMITGFPSASEADLEITRYQITAKIGDSLAAGKPVLVPYSPAVRDIAGTTGVYLFDSETFSSQLALALDVQDNITLPEEFSFAAATRSFTKAEADAARTTAKEIFSDILSVDPNRVKDSREKIVLVWKQHDAGLYGRRVDQLARKLKRSQPDADIIVLEFLHSSSLDHYRAHSADWTSDFSAISELADRKAGGGWHDQDGVRYVSLHHETDAKLTNRFAEFLAREQIGTKNSRFILFPIIRSLHAVWDLIRQYPFTVDIVDNQFAWAGEKDREMLASQYRALFGAAQDLVFNSERNLDHFRALDMIPPSTPVSVVPNWYQRPVSLRSFSRDRTRSEARFIYTGNMNDRIDWDLMGRVAELGYPLHLVGSAYRASTEFRDLINRNNVVYHGPLNEEATYRLIAASKVAIMPHLRDKFSDFMNPLKLLMYYDIGLPVVTTDVEGINKAFAANVVDDSGSFVETARQLIETDPAHIDPAKNLSSAP